MTIQIFEIAVCVVAILAMSWIMSKSQKLLLYAFALVLASPVLIVEASYDFAKKMIDHE